MIRDLTDEELDEYLALSKRDRNELTSDERNRRATLYAQAVLYKNKMLVANLIEARRQLRARMK